MINNRQLKKQGYLTRLGYTVALISKKVTKTAKILALQKLTHLMCPSRRAVATPGALDGFPWCPFPSQVSDRCPNLSSMRFALTYTVGWLGLTFFLSNCIFSWQWNNSGGDFSLE